MNAKDRAEDLGIKIGTPEDVFWTRVKKVAEQDISDAKNSIAFNEEVVKIASLKIKHE